MALYLKYRPQSLNGLIGQDGIKKLLQQAFLGDKLSHAYLFVGPRGTGKTSTARILAKMVNCEDAKNSPCNKCLTCTSITDGSNLDLIEVDAASNRGIDDIRSLRENIKLSPTSGKKKVYIIDEIHMLTTEAFNALLKTLEEPPKHALFILATTDVQKVPQTILSRVQRLDFQLASSEEINKALSNIINQEKIEIEDEALKLLIKKAEGSFRDGIKLLDQLYSRGEKITVAHVVDALQSVEFSLSNQLLTFLAEKNTKEALMLVFTNKRDAKNWTTSLMDILRQLVLVKNGLGVLVEPEWDGEKYQVLIGLAEKFSINDLVKDLELLQQALEKLRFASIPSLPLEIAVVEMCMETSDKVQVTSEQSTSMDEPKVSSMKEQGSSLSKESSIPVIPAQAGIQKEELSIGLGMTKLDEDKKDDVVGAEVAVLQEKWNFVLETVKPYNYSLEALLRLVKILDCQGGIVLLEVPYSFHQRILEAPKSRDLLESVLSDVLGRQIKVSCVLGNKPLTVEDVANVEVAADDEVVRAAAEIFGTDPVN